MALLEEVAAFLAAEGLGTLGTNIFKANMPASPDACCCVYETGGSGSVSVLGDVGTYENPGVQIAFRGAPEDYTGPRTKAQTALNSMEGISVDQLLSGTKYLIVRSLQQPFPLGGPDENLRWKIICNYRIEKEPS